MKSSLKMIGLLTATLMIQACAKDKSVDDYKRQQAEKDAAVYDAIAGRYSGQIVDAKTKKILGGFEIDLSSEKRTTTPTDGSAATPTAVLKSIIYFVDYSVFSKASDQSSYDPDSGNYAADFKIPVSGLATATDNFSINGHFVGKHLVGHLSGEDNGAGADFDLVKDGPALKLSKDRPPTDMHRFYSDQVIDPLVGKVRIVAEVGYSPTELPVDHFINVFLFNQKIIEMRWNLDHGVSAADFRSSLWDLMAGSLTGNTPSTAPGVTDYITCSGLYSFEQTEPFICDYNSSRSSNIHSVFKPCPGNNCP